MDLSTGRLIAAQAPDATAPPEIQARSGVLDGVKIGVGMFIVLPLIIIVIVFLFISFKSSFEPRLSESYRIAPTDTTPPYNAANVEARNAGWNWAHSNKIDDVDDCESLLDEQKIVGCEANVNARHPE